MEYRTLGRTGMKVSPLCLGAMNFGDPTQETESIRIIHQALDAGINFVDTANVYNRGASEEIVGKALKGRREEVVLATKVHGRMGEGPNQQGNSRYHIMQQVEASLRRLQTDHIDLYQLHRPDPATPVDEQLSTLDILVRQGKVRYIGTSTFPAWHLCEFLWLSDRHNLERLVCEQPPYNILCRRIEKDVLRLCAKYGFGVIPWSPLAGGWLTGKYRRDREAPADSRAARRGWSFDSDAAERRFDAIEDLISLAEDHGATLSQFALAWLLTRPEVTAPIIGPRTSEQLADNVGALQVELLDKALEAVDEIVPPGTDLIGLG